MRLFVLPKTFTGSSTVDLVGKDAHYLTRVLRLKIGQTFTARDVNGTLWTLTLLSKGTHACTLSCSAVTETQELSPLDSLPSYKGDLPEIHLYQCVCKGKKMEQIIRQATELGVRRIIPVTSKYCVVDLSGKEEHRQERYMSIVKEALQQSGSTVTTEVAHPIHISELATEWKDRGSGVVFHQVAKEDQKEIASIIEEHSRIRPKAPFAIVIGPEGGFSADEISLLESHSFSPVLLKTNILRAETAAISAIAIVQFLLMTYY